MKFSLFFEMQISHPTRDKEAECFRNCLAQAVLADEVGFDGVWEVEHHGLYEYSHSSAPEIFLSFVAAKTKRIRVGHGVTLTPYRYNHPIRIAERIAALDILSEGRVDWGSGKSSSRVEQLAFENDLTTLHDQWLEALQVIPRMWQQDVFEWKGRFYNIPRTQVIPKPVQKPHPPIYAACSKPDSAESVGALGIGALNFAVGTDAYLKEKVQRYRAAVERAAPGHYEKTNHFACTPPALVLADDRKACEYGFRGARFFQESLARYYFTQERPLGPLDVPRDFLAEDELQAAMQFRTDLESESSMVIGDPVHAKEQVRRFVEDGVDELILVMQLGTVPHELILESIRTFAEKVMPDFK
jgi:alkanesulfonate monooxygenase SsuD/methylene tetrahydromethanopterin reductase-like flavin-dependent oxidoreductase (luciferase family)